MSKLFTFEEVAQHNKREDLWMIIDKKVYDITAFVDEVSKRNVTGHQRQTGWLDP
jgi:hypothetical protein